MAYSSSSNQTGKKNMNFKSDSFVQLAIMAVILVAVAGASWYGYTNYSAGKAAEAQKVLMDCLAQFDKAEQDKNTNWTTMQEVVSVAYDAQKNSKAAPYLLALESDAFTHLNKKEEALDRMEKAVSSLSTGSPLYYLYKTKYALMKMDGDQKSIESGIALLKELANDASNKENDQACFYLGLYYWSQDNLDAAKQAWEPLMKLAHEGEGSSPWAVRAQEKMKLLI